LALTTPVDTGKFTGHGSAIRPRRGRVEIHPEDQAFGIDALGRLRPERAGMDPMGWAIPAKPGF
jgi:hypothetical protein